MHDHSIESWRHQHVFLGERHDRHARRTLIVVVLTLAMMVGEIVGGTMFGSMAVVADGWHMSTHAAALGIAATAYWFARRHQHSPRFSFGTGKLGELAAFSSAIVLGLVALYIAVESLARLAAPISIHFAEATWVALLGLIVNVASAVLLFDSDHDHHDIHRHETGHELEHDHDDDDDDDDHHDHDHHHHLGGDTNIRAAFVHVVADALTSVLAIIALLAGRYYGWVWLDPIMGIVGAVVIASWSFGLLRSAGLVLLDAVPSQPLARRIRARLEAGGDRVTDLHVWQLGPRHAAVIASIVSDQPQDPAVYKARLAAIHGLSHVTVEVHRCPRHGADTLAA